jgi:hypothetical protein
MYKEFAGLYLGTNNCGMFYKKTKGKKNILFVEDNTL